MLSSEKSCVNLDGVRDIGGGAGVEIGRMVKNIGSGIGGREKKGGGKKLEVKEQAGGEKRF